MTLLASMLVPVVGTAFGKDKPGDVLGGWVDNWTAGPEHDITILREAGGSLFIEGFATWGASDPERVERGGVNIGEFSVSVPGRWIVDQALEFAIGTDGAIPADEAAEYDCILHLELIGHELVVSDNGICGGHNVRFDGVYRRE
ncbi:hypothetical protein [Devosia sp. CAU 1758]